MDVNGFGQNKAYFYDNNFTLTVKSKLCFISNNFCSKLGIKALVLFINSKYDIVTLFIPVLSPVVCFSPLLSARNCVSFRIKLMCSCMTAAARVISLCSVSAGGGGGHALHSGVVVVEGVE